MAYHTDRDPNTGVPTGVSSTVVPQPPEAPSQSDRRRSIRRKALLVTFFSCVLLVVRTTPLRARLDYGLTVLETVLIFLLVCLGGALLYDTLFYWRCWWPLSAGRR